MSHNKSNKSKHTHMHTKTEIVCVHAHLPKSLLQYFNILIRFVDNRHSRQLFSAFLRKKKKKYNPIENLKVFKLYD